MKGKRRRRGEELLGIVMLLKWETGMISCEELGFSQRD